ncbi:MAG TPA: hypothetical protein VFY14_02635 [Streptomyces sp.]|nr:hypothetical protein [Streptomyces sp.]
MIAGRQLAAHMRTDLPPDVLETALWRRGITRGPGLVHHRDRGPRHVSVRYGERLTETDAAASVAVSYDNALALAIDAGGAGPLDILPISAGPVPPRRCRTGA